MTGTRDWRREGIVYQIYPRSFNDADGDGVGDLRGIVEKVDYVADLGVDVVWLNPVYDSPQVDNGYDIRDYRSIYPEYGTMADWEALRDRLHERDVRLVMDLVVNHTSDEHEWFRRSRAGDDDYRDYYVWREGDRDERPNNWESMFGGPAWSYDDERDAWYLHLFDERMPDLNWRNPAVRDDVHEMMRWWLAKGIDGFRLDVINLLSKPEGLPDGDPAASITGSNYFVNGPAIHEYVRTMHDVVFDDYDVVTVGETIDVTPADARQFVAEDGLDMVFPFEHMDVDAGGEGPWDIADWELRDLKTVTERWQTALGDGWIGLYLSNHDQPRVVSRFGDEAFRRESATMLGTYLFTLRGTPFVYQGQELGVTNTPFESLDEFRDPATILRVERALASGSIEAFEEIAESVNYWSRDNARTPMPWSDAEHAGFTDGEPWIKLNPEHEEVNVESERADGDSVLAYYRRLVEFREANPVAVYGDYEPVLDDHPEIFAYLRTPDEDGPAVEEEVDRLLTVLHFGDGEPAFELPESVDYGAADLLLANYPVEGDDGPASFDLRPYEARVYGLT